MMCLCQHTHRFIAAASKSTTRGTNSNAMRKDYVFGNGSMGIGYYHTDTQEAYAILVSHITPLFTSYSNIERSLPPQ